MREGLTFSKVWQDLAEALDRTTAELDGDTLLAPKMLTRFNKEYQAAYELREWEDAWKDGELTPVDRVLAWSDLEDARCFELWTADPRNTPGAVQCIYTTAREGVTLAHDYETVYAFWIPKIHDFTRTAYANGTTYEAGVSVLATDGHVYVSLTSTTGNEPSVSPNHWRQQPVLACLATEVMDMAVGRKLIGEGSYASGGTLKRDARLSLDRKAAREFVRLASQRGRAWHPALSTCS